MEITVTRNDDELTLAPLGRLDSLTSGEFAEALEKHFTEDVMTLVIDFSGVDFISSKGLRVLVSAYKNLGERKMEITEANASVMEVLQLSGLLKVITVR